MGFQRTVVRYRKNKKINPYFNITRESPIFSRQHCTRLVWRDCRFGTSCCRLFHHTCLELRSSPCSLCWTIRIKWEYVASCWNQFTRSVNDEIVFSTRLYSSDTGQRPRLDIRHVKCTWRSKTFERCLIYVLKNKK